MCNAKTGTIDIYVGRRNWGRKEKVYVAYFSIPWDVWLLKAGVGTESASVASCMKTNTVSIRSLRLFLCLLGNSRLRFLALI